MVVISFELGFDDFLHDFNILFVDSGVLKLVLIGFIELEIILVVEGLLVSLEFWFDNKVTNRLKDI